MTSLSIADVRRTVAVYYGVTVADMVGKRRMRQLSRPRMIAMMLSREMTGKTLNQVGIQFGGRDHSTVHHSARWARDCNPITAREIDELWAILTAIQIGRQQASQQQGAA